MTCFGGRLSSAELQLLLSRCGVLTELQREYCCYHLAVCCRWARGCAAAGIWQLLCSSPHPAGPAEPHGAALLKVPGASNDLTG